MPVVEIEDITEQEAARERAQAEAAARRAAEEAERQAAAARARTDSQQRGGGAAARGIEDKQAAEGGDEQEEEPPEPLTEEEQAELASAEAIKQQGNEAYLAGDLDTAIERYGEALSTAPERARERAVYFANRAACHLKREAHAEAAADCSAALELQPRYLKALLRRSAAYEALDDLERALMDAQKALQVDPGNPLATKAVARLEPVVNERREKLKDEMLGKLKELGNTVLGKFGLSLDNFKAEKDPDTGSYSIKFQQ